MPTANRPWFVEGAVSFFVRQRMSDAELIIVRNGTCRADPHTDSVGQVRHLNAPGVPSVGFKRNVACQQAHGSIIIHWDDDDWHAPRRIAYQIEALRSSGADICGVSRLLLYEPAANRAFEYVYPPGGRPWVAGGTMCYTKAFWERNRFPDLNIGEDTHFVWSAQPKKILVLPDNTFYVAIIHPGNTSRKITSDRRYRPYPVEEIRRIMGDDFAFYEQMRGSALAGVGR